MEDPPPTSLYYYYNGGQDVDSYISLSTHYSVNSLV